MIAYTIAVTEVEYKSRSTPTKYIPYLALTGELWDVFCEDLGENWLRYNGTALYCDDSGTWASAAARQALNFPQF